MDIIIWLIIITSIAGVFGTGFGGALACCFGRGSDKAVGLLLGFAGGLMLSVVCFDLIPEAISPENAPGGNNLFLAAAGISLGCLVIYLLNDIIDQASVRGAGHANGGRLVPAAPDGLIGHDLYAIYFHRHAALRRQAAKDRRRTRPTGQSVPMPVRGELLAAGAVMALAIALHNLPEGMVIGAAYASEAGEQAARYGGSGLMLALIIGMHDIPEGMAVAVPLIGGGMRRSGAVLIAALTGVPTVMGALLGYSVGVMSPFALSLSLSFAGGAMLYVVFGELLPESQLIRRSKTPALAALAGMLLGLFIIFAG